MGITERLTTIHENVDSVHEAGYIRGESAGYRTGHSVGYVEGETAGYNRGVTDGKKSEYDAFWDAYQENGNRSDYRHAFAGLCWTNDIFKPKYDIKPAGSGNTGYMMFRDSNLEGDMVELLNRAGVKLDVSGISGGPQYIFSLCRRITRWGELDCSNFTMLDSGFNGSPLLNQIDKLIVNSETKFGGTFTGCTALENITFGGVIGQNIDFSPCTQLSKASITNIINHLSDTESSKTLTLSATAIATAFGAYSADYDGDGKHDAWIGNDIEEWIELIGSKPNWNIVAV